MLNSFLCGPPLLSEESFSVHFLPFRKKGKPFQQFFSADGGRLHIQNFAAPINPRRFAALTFFILGTSMAILFFFLQTPHDDPPLFLIYDSLVAQRLSSPLSESLFLNLFYGTNYTRINSNLACINSMFLNSPFRILGLGPGRAYLKMDRGGRAGLIPNPRARQGRAGTKESQKSHKKIQITSQVTNFEWIFWFFCERAGS